MVESEPQNYDDNGILIAQSDERDEKIKSLEEDIALAQFRSLLKSKAARANAAKILPQFQRGTLTVENWKLLDVEHKKLYLMIHGTVEIPGLGIAKATRRFTAPITNQQRTILHKKRLKRNIRKKLASASRKRNRR